MKKKYIVLVIFMFLPLLFFSNEKKTKINFKNNNESTIKKFEMNKFELYRILFWSSYGVNGLTGLINSFAHLGYAYDIAQDLTDLMDDVSQYTDTISFLDNFSTYYPAVMFGMHFVLAGFSFIPAAGGIVYGAGLYLMGISFAAILSISTNPFDLSFSGTDMDDYNDRLWDIYTKILDPKPYFIVGTLSILFGVAELVMFLFFRKESLRRKFPYMQKSFSFFPGGMTIKLDI